MVSEVTPNHSYATLKLSTSQLAKCQHDTWIWIDRMSMSQQHSVTSQAYVDAHTPYTVQAISLKHGLQPSVARLAVLLVRDGAALCHFIRFKLQGVCGSNFAHRLLAVFQSVHWVGTVVLEQVLLATLLCQTTEAHNRPTCRPCYSFCGCEKVPSCRR